MDVHQIPHDSQLEGHIIGSMIYDPNCIGEVFDIVKPKFFYHVKFSSLCEKIFELWSENESSIDLPTLVPTITELGLTVDYICQLMEPVVSTGNIRHHAEKLRDIAALRAAVKVGQELVSSAGSLRDGDAIKQAIVQAEGNLSRIVGSTMTVDSMAPMKEILMEFHEEFEKTYYGNGSGVTGISSGFTDLDNLTAGFQRSDLIILAARPSVGKTALSLKLAKNMSVDLKQPGAYFSLEMAKKTLVRRMIADAARIDLQSLNTGLIDGDDWEKYTMALGVLSEANLVIDDQGGSTISEIRAKCRKIKRERGLSYIMVDYLGLIQGEKGMSRYDIVSENTRQLKNIAKEFDVPVICLCQLSRSVEQRADKRPVLSDLRESGEIEQTADLIMFLHRDDYYDAEAAKKNIIEIIIAKQRNGPTGLVELMFLKQFNSFMSLDRGQNDQPRLPLPAPIDQKENKRRQWAK